MKAPSEFQPADLIPKVVDDLMNCRSWEAVAKRHELDLGEMQQWPTEFAFEWQKSLGESEDRMGIEIAAELRLVLRRLLRSESEDTRIKAAQQLLKLHIENARIASRQATNG